MSAKPEQKKSEMITGSSSETVYVPQRPPIEHFPDFRTRLAEACEHLRQNRPVSAYECLRNLQDHIEYILKK